MSIGRLVSRRPGVSTLLVGALLVIAAGEQADAQSAGPASPAQSQSGGAASDQGAPPVPSLPGIMVEPRGWNGSPPGATAPGNDSTHGCPANERKLELIV